MSSPPAPVCAAGCLASCGTCQLQSTRGIGVLPASRDAMDMLRETVAAGTVLLGRRPAYFGAACQAVRRAAGPGSAGAPAAHPQGLRRHHRAARMWPTRPTWGCWPARSTSSLPRPSGCRRLGVRPAAGSGTADGRLAAAPTRSPGPCGRAPSSQAGRVRDHQAGRWPGRGAARRRLPGRDQRPPGSGPWPHPAHRSAPSAGGRT
jgi:hypothetical protein